MQASGEAIFIICSLQNNVQISWIGLEFKNILSQHEKSSELFIAE